MNNLCYNNATDPYSCGGIDMPVGGIYDCIDGEWVLIGHGGPPPSKPPTNIKTPLIDKNHGNWAKVALFIGAGWMIWRYVLKK